MHSRNMSFSQNLSNETITIVKCDRALKGQMKRHLAFGTTLVAQNNKSAVLSEEESFSAIQREYSDLDKGLLERSRFILVSFGSVAKVVLKYF